MLVTIDKNDGRVSVRLDEHYSEVYNSLELFQAAYPASRTAEMERELLKAGLAAESRKGTLVEAKAYTLAEVYAVKGAK